MLAKFRAIGKQPFIRFAVIALFCLSIFNVSLSCWNMVGANADAIEHEVYSQHSPNFMTDHLMTDHLMTAQQLHTPTHGQPCSHLVSDLASHSSDLLKPDLHQHCALNCSISLSQSSFAHELIAVFQALTIRYTSLIISKPQQAWRQNPERPPQFS